MSCLVPYVTHKYYHQCTYFKISHDSLQQSTKKNFFLISYTMPEPRSEIDLIVFCRDQQLNHIDPNLWVNPLIHKCTSETRKVGKIIIPMQRNAPLHNYVPHKLESLPTIYIPMHQFECRANDVAVEWNLQSELFGSPFAQGKNDHPLTLDSLGEGPLSSLRSKTLVNTLKNSTM